MARKMTEEEIQKETVESLLSLGGGELDNEPLKYVHPYQYQSDPEKVDWNDLSEKHTFRYHYEGAPEWATEDFSRDERYSCAADVFTVIDLSGERAYQWLLVGRETYKLAKAYYSESEKECPIGELAEYDADHAGELITAHDGICPFCEEEIAGEDDEHGYISLGTIGEVVYRKAWPLIVLPGEGENILLFSSDDEVKGAIWGWASDQNDDEMRLYGCQEGDCWKWNLTPGAISELFRCYSDEATKLDDMPEDEIELNAKIREAIQYMQNWMKANPQK